MPVGEGETTEEEETPPRNIKRFLIFWLITSHEITIRFRLCSSRKWGPVYPCWVKELPVLLYYCQTFNFSNNLYQIIEMTSIDDFRVITEFWSDGWSDRRWEPSIWTGVCQKCDKKPISNLTSNNSRFPQVGWNAAFIRITLRQRFLYRLLCHCRQILITKQLI